MKNPKVAATKKKATKPKVTVRGLRYRRYRINDPEREKRYERADVLRSRLYETFSAIALDETRTIEERVAAAKIIVGGGCC